MPDGAGRRDAWVRMSGVGALGAGRVPGRVLGQAPAMWEEFIEAILRPAGGQLAEHVGEVRKRGDAVLGAGAGQAVEVRGAARRIV